MGFIYKIVIGEDIYIGSTKNKYLCNRQYTHNYKLKNGCEYKLYKFCRENKVEKIICEMLEKVDNENIVIKEQEYIKMLEPSLNSHKAYQTIEEKKINDKKYREENKDKIKKYREENKNRRKEYDKKYYEENKKGKIKCDKCGCMTSKINLKRHQKRMICRKMWDYTLLNSDDEE